MCTIKLLEEKDLPAAVALARIMHREGAFSVRAFSDERLKDFLRRSISSPRYLCLLAEIEGKLVGAFVAVIASNWFSEEDIAEEKAMYVVPEHRKSMIAPRLIKGFLAWAEEYGVPEVTAGTTAEINTEGVRALYEALGFETIGYILRKRIG